MNPGETETFTSAPAPVPGTSSANRGWFKAVRGGDGLELIRANPNAFVLAFIIASRARYRPGFHADGLQPGEAFVGDYENYGMSRQQYRTALAQLSRWQFATSRTTSRGTIARLVDTRLFEVLPQAANHPVNHRVTTGQPASNHLPTTNKNIRTYKNERTLNEAGSGEGPRFVTGTIELS